ncbi:Transcription factor SOX-11, partial [Chytridiales sp. JEL 0842]
MELRSLAAMSGPETSQPLGSDSNVSTPKEDKEEELSDSHSHLKRPRSTSPLTSGTRQFTESEKAVLIAQYNLGIRSIAKYDNIHESLAMQFKCPTDQIVMWFYRYDNHQNKERTGASSIGVPPTDSVVVSEPTGGKTDESSTVEQPDILQQQVPPLIGTPSTAIPSITVIQNHSGSSSGEPPNISKILPANDVDPTCLSAESFDGRLPVDSTDKEGSSNHRDDGKGNLTVTNGMSPTKVVAPPPPPPSSDAIRPSQRKKRKTDSINKSPQVESHIKRPRNAFIIFRNTHQPSLIESTSNPRLSSKDFSSNIAEIWKSMSDKERAPYEKMAKEEREAHKKVYPNFQYSSTKRPRNNPHTKKQQLAQGSSVRSRIEDNVANIAKVFESNIRGSVSKTENGTLNETKGLVVLLAAALDQNDGRTDMNSSDSNEVPSDQLQVTIENRQDEDRCEEFVDAPRVASPALPAIPLSDSLVQYYERGVRAASSFTEQLFDIAEELDLTYKEVYEWFASWESQRPANSANSPNDDADEPPASIASQLDRHEFDDGYETDSTAMLSEAGGEEEDRLIANEIEPDAQTSRAPSEVPVLQMYETIPSDEDISMSPESPAVSHPPPTKKRKADISIEKSFVSGSHIKRPRNAFIIFRNTHQPSLIESTSNTHLSSRDFSSNFAEIWKSLSAKEKAPYVEMARQEREAHKKMHPEFQYYAGKRGKGGRLSSAEERAASRSVKKPRTFEKKMTDPKKKSGCNPSKHTNLLAPTSFL